MRLRLRKQWVLVLFCLPLYAMEQTKVPQSQGVEQSSPLCTVPDNVLSTICDHLQTWKDIHALGSTCKILDRRATVPGKEIRINPIKQINIPGHEPVFVKAPTEVIFDGVVALIHRIVAKKGRNSMDLDLGCLNLGAYPVTFSKFLAVCCSPSIVSYISHMSLCGNDITHLPREIVHLTHLKSLILSRNTIDQESLRLIAKMKSLEYLNIGKNNLSKLPDEFSQLTALKYLEISCNKLSFDAIKPLFALKTLTDLNVHGNHHLSYRSLWELLIQKQWPRLRDFFAIDIEGTEEDYDLPEPPGIDVTIGSSESS